MRLCDAFHRVQRLLEEQRLLVTEAQQFVTYLSAERDRCLHGALMVEEGALPTPVAYPRHDRVQRYFDLERFAQPDLAFKSGWKAVLLRGAWECERLLAMAYAVFGKSSHLREVAPGLQPDGSHDHDAGAAAAVAPLDQEEDDDWIEGE